MTIDEKEFKEFEEEFRPRLHDYVKLLNNVHNNVNYYLFSNNRKEIMIRLQTSYDDLDNLLLFHEELMNLLEKKFKDSVNEEGK